MSGAVRWITCVSLPAMVDADVLHQLAEELVDGVVAEVAD